MPLYEYECTKCHKRAEKIEKVDGPHLKKCPYCGGKVEQMISRSAIQFKGAGWYVTDYAGKKSTSAADGDSADNSEKSEKKDSYAKDTPKDPKDSKESKDTKDSKEPKSSKETKDSKPPSEKKTEKKKN